MMYWKISTPLLYILSISAPIHAATKICENHLKKNVAMNGRSMKALTKLDDISATENKNVESFVLPDGTTFSSIYSFATDHPQEPISALVVRVVTENLIEPPLGDVTLTTRILTVSEAKQAIRSTYSNAHQTRMQFISSSRIDELINALLISTEKPNAKIVEISEKNQIIGLLMYRPIEYLDETVTLTSWIWRDEKLNEGTSRSFRHLIFSILKQQPYRYTVAAVHLANRRSMRHFERLGFYPLCIARHY